MDPRASFALLGSKRVARSRLAYDMPLGAAFPSAWDRSVFLSTRASLMALLSDSWIPASSLFPPAASGLLQPGAVPFQPALRLRARLSPIDASRSADGTRGFAASPPHSPRSVNAGVPRRRRSSSPSMLPVLGGSSPLAATVTSV
ncbi:hypothetical protein T01_2265 [Trichinella spiralis]|uniref:Uncharacterized protein n=1 Tax=Trichinella spiralis TaxID=6334 RepID=A0A0V1AMM3_TRISP|nr:hypothetical protein T01_2265 [Trichinella spiralis]